MKAALAKQRGQALLIGVIVLFFVALSMYLIATFGRHVQQKIHAQTTADATALSLATMEAETFNYIAFANRAQVAQYVTALNMQAYVSYLSWWEVAAAQVIFYAKFLYAAPYVGATLATAIIQGATAFKKAVGLLVNGADAGDLAIDNLVMANNQALWITEVVAAEITNAHLLSGGFEFFEQNNPVGSADPWTYTNADLAINGALALINAKRFNDAFYDKGSTPSTPWTQTVDAPMQTVMTEEVNATRADKFLLARGILPPIDPGFDDFFNFINLFLGKSGQSKLTQSTDVASISRTLQGDSKLTTGAVMASRDTMSIPIIPFVFSFDINSSVMATQNSNQHCRASGASPECVSDGNHVYKGIAPYMTYQAGLSNNGNAGEDFHQPDVLVWMNKSSAESSLSQAFVINFPGASTIDTRSGVNNTGLSQALPDGINVISRAQAYYHRPGNWQEPPNLFNPFWHARLAPVADAMTSLTGISELGPLQEMLKTLLLTH